MEKVAYQLTIAVTVHIFGGTTGSMAPPLQYVPYSIFLPLGGALVTVILYDSVVC